MVAGLRKAGRTIHYTPPGNKATPVDGRALRYSAGGRAIEQWVMVFAVARWLAIVAMTAIFIGFWISSMLTPVR